MSLFSLSLERHCLSAMIKYPQKYTDLYHIKEEFFSHSAHRVIWRVVIDYVQKKEPLNDLLVSNRIKSIGIATFEEIDIEQYIKTLFSVKITEESVKSFFDELTVYKVKRDYVSLSKDIANVINNTHSTNVKDIIKDIDNLFVSSVDRSLSDKNEVEDIAANCYEVVQDIAKNPISKDSFYFGPFESVNKIYGSLHRPGNITCIAARSGVAKTTLSLFYNVKVALKYDLPILWCDFSEMSERELQFRLAACLTDGIVPLNAIEYGTWVKNPTYKKAIEEKLPLVKKLKIFYKDIGRMDENELFSFVRRVRFNKFGRDNPFLWVLDYLKPFNTDDYNAPEWKIMGHFIQNCKTFLKDENISLWTALQANRSGITTGKTANQVDDSENAFGMSDRIIQQASHGFLVRRKLNSELELEHNRYGNMIMKAVKYRHLGEQFQRAVDRVEMSDGKHKENYINLRSRSFLFEDMGDLFDQVAQENNIVDTNQSDGELSPL